MVGIFADTPEGLPIGSNIAVHLGTGEPTYYEIVNRDKILVPIEKDNLSAGGTLTYFEVTELDPPADQIYQVYAILVDNNVIVRIKQPAATNRFGTNKLPAGGELNDIISSTIKGELINLWIAQDYPPSIQIENYTDETSLKPTLYFIGWRYQVKKLVKVPEFYTRIVIGGIGR